MCSSDLEFGVCVVEAAGFGKVGVLADSVSSSRERNFCLNLSYRFLIFGRFSDITATRELCRVTRRKGVRGNGVKSGIGLMVVQTKWRTLANDVPTHFQQTSERRLPTRFKHGLFPMLGRQTNAAPRTAPLRITSTQL